MKVAHVFKSFYPDTYGGIERVIDELCIGMSVYGVKSSVFSMSENNIGWMSRNDSYQVYFFKKNFGIASTNFSFSALQKFKYLVSDADLIHYHFPNPFSDVLHLYSKISKPYVVTYHSDIVKQKLLSKAYAPIMNKFLGSADALVATSENYVKTSSFLSSFKRKVSVVPIGISENEFMSPSAEKSNYWNDRLPEKFFLYFGALRYYKGLDVVIQAIDGTDMHLVIAGSGPEKNYLAGLVKKLELEHQVHFISSVSDEDKFALIKLCYAFVFPSNVRSEAFGISLLEASACGKALISCEIGTGTSFVNINNLTGFVVKSFSVVELREAMLKLNQSLSLTEKFGENSRKRYEALFRSQRQADSYFELYERVLSCR